MRLTWARLGAAAAVAAVAGAVVYWAGWINVGASTGHWKITTLVLNNAMVRSVKFHAPDKVPYDLSDPALIRLGAGYYETGCAICHGSPARPRGAVAREMTPEPPDLAPKLPPDDRWRPQDLFWLVQNGVKFSAMPAWPALEREDEIWAMAAFLMAYNDLDPQSYNRLAFGEEPAAGPSEVPAPDGAAGSQMPIPAAMDQSAGPAASGRPGISAGTARILTDCRRCHADDGRGDPNGAFPRLDIQTEAALQAALLAYSQERRASGVMQTATRDLTEAELSELAAYFASVEPAPVEGRFRAFTGEQLRRGEEIANRGIPEDDVGACAACHMATPRNPAADEFPALDGQYYRYLKAQLELFAKKEFTRGGGRFKNVMTEASHTLDPDDIEAVAAYFADKEPGE